MEPRIRDSVKSMNRIYERRRANARHHHESRFTSHESRGFTGLAPGGHAAHFLQHIAKVRGVLEIIRPLDKDENRVRDALRLALLLSALLFSLSLVGSMIVVAAGRRRTVVT